MTAHLQTRSPRLSDLSHRLPGRPEAAYKRLQRFLAASEPQTALLRLLHPETPFMVADMTEIQRPQAHRTEYVGLLKDGQTPGFWLLILATPFRGQALPFQAIVYSSRTLADEATSRNQEHQRAARQVRDLVADRVLVFDPEFSYEELLAALLPSSRGGARVPATGASGGCTPACLSCSSTRYPYPPTSGTGYAARCWTTSASWSSAMSELKSEAQYQ